MSLLGDPQNATLKIQFILKKECLSRKAFLLCHGDDWLLGTRSQRDSETRESRGRIFGKFPVGREISKI
jgi:hypothetical protein